MKRDFWVAAFGLAVGLLASGLILLTAARPRGKPVELLPAPTPLPLMVDVSGAVANPGVYTLLQDSRVQDAIEAAGGLSALADPSQLNLAARLKDGTQVFIPTLVPTLSAENLPSGSIRQGQPILPVTPGKVNINTAGLEELDTLPGIGPITAQKIIDYRQENGPFAAIEDIVKVDGIGPATLEKLKELITVGYPP
jgi:competence protein ComEA